MKVLMVRPTYFNINYAINPHMLDESGNLNSINFDLAQEQWERLKSVFESIGIKVEVIEGGEALPDMVFSANHALPLQHKKEVIFGKMNSSARSGEIPLFKDWYIKQNYKIYDLNLDTGSSFEGMGDAIWAGRPDTLLGGYGFRTDIEVYEQIQKLLNIRVITLKLISDKFYHLDTCLCVLNKETVAIVSEAFDSESLGKIQKSFKNIINIDLQEAKDYFAANSFCPDEKHVILQKGSKNYIKQLESYGFNPIEVETSEFIKAGGSVFCMKMVVES